VKQPNMPNDITPNHWLNILLHDHELEAWEREQIDLPVSERETIMILGQEFRPMYVLRPDVSTLGKTQVKVPILRPI
jgi:hypothetical protein